MLELFSFLLTLGTALKGAFDTLKQTEKKTIGRKLHQVHIEIQTIIVNAERLFLLINNTEKYCNEYGKDKLSRILSDNFESQFKRLILLAESLQQNELSNIFNILDKDLKKQIQDILFFKGDSLRNGLQRMSDGKLSLKDNQLYIKYPYGKTELAFPELQEEIERIEELKKCSKEFGRCIYSAVGIEFLV